MFKSIDDTMNMLNKWDREFFKMMNQADRLPKFRENLELQIKSLLESNSVNFEPSDEVVLYRAHYLRDKIDTHFPLIKSS